MIIIEEKPVGVKVGDTLPFKPLPEIMKMISYDWKFHQIEIPKDMVNFMIVSTSIAVEKYPTHRAETDRFFAKSWYWPLAFFEIPEQRIVKMCDMEPGQTGKLIHGNEYVRKLRNGSTSILNSDTADNYPSPECESMVRLCDLKLTEV